MRPLPTSYPPFPSGVPHTQTRSMKREGTGAAAANCAEIKAIISRTIEVRIPGRERLWLCFSFAKLDELFVKAAVRSSKSGARDYNPDHESSRTRSCGAEDTRDP